MSSPEKERALTVPPIRARALDHDTIYIAIPTHPLLEYPTAISNRSAFSVEPRTHKKIGE